MGSIKVWTRRLLDLVLVLLIIHFLGWSSYTISNRLGIYILSIGNESFYITKALQRLIQLVFVIVLMKLLFKKTLKEWGFNLNNAKTGLKLFLKFLPAFFIIELLFLLFLKFILKDNVGIGYTPRLLNLLVIFGFQGLFTGTSEEPVFRGMVIGVLKRSWNMRLKLLKCEIEITTILSAIIFAIAHMEFSFSPFRVIYWNYWQMLTAFLLGLYYAYAFEKTKSLLNPILSHNASNVIIVFLSIALS